MNSKQTMNQFRGVSARRLLMQPVFNENLLDQILDAVNLHEAFKKVKSNKGAPGIDGVTIAEFREWVKSRWSGIKESLWDGSYEPSAVRRVEIPKDNGGIRKLGIPTVLDRTIQQAIYQVLNKYLDYGFSDSSYGFRPKRNAHQALNKLQSYVKGGYKWAVDVDLEKFFDTVNHDMLMERLSRYIKDKRVLKLIGSFLRAGVMVGNELEDVEEGVPQGGPLSPLLANIMLDDFDKELEKRGHKFARYADDFIIMVKSKRAGERVMEGITHYLDKKLKLKVNKEKSQVVRANECSFLGFTFRGKKIVWTEKAYQKFRKEIRRLTSRTWGVSMKHRLKKLRQYINGWMGYYRLSEYYTVIPRIDQWIRRRIRMCYLKMWKRPRTMIGKLISLGVSIPNAVGLGRSSKSWARKSKNPTINQALNDKYLKEQGLVSVRERWIKFHYP